MALRGGADALRKILNTMSDYRGINTFVETGTADCATTLEALKVFRHVETVELSPVLAAEAREKLWVMATVHEGSSGVLIHEIAKGLKGVPVFWYLDGHYCGGYENKTSNLDPFPLWRELRALRDRNARDIVVIDDVHAFGKGHKETPDWAGCTTETIKAAFHPGQVRASETREDQFILWLKPVDA